MLLVAGAAAVGSCGGLGEDDGSLVEAGTNGVDDESLPDDPSDEVSVFRDTPAS